MNGGSFLVRHPGRGYTGGRRSATLQTRCHQDTLLVASSDTQGNGGRILIKPTGGTLSFLFHLFLFFTEFFLLLFILNLILKRVLNVIAFMVAMRFNTRLRIKSNKTSSVLQVERKFQKTLKTFLNFKSCF